MIDLAAVLYTEEEGISGLEDKSEELSRRQQERPSPLSPFDKKRM